MILKYENNEYFDVSAEFHELLYSDKTSLSKALAKNIQGLPVIISTGFNRDLFNIYCRVHDQISNFINVSSYAVVDGNIMSYLGIPHGCQIKGSNYKYMLLAGLNHLTELTIEDTYGEYAQFYLRFKLGKELECTLETPFKKKETFQLSDIKGMVKYLEENTSSTFVGLKNNWRDITNGANYILYNWDALENPIIKSRREISVKCLNVAQAIIDKIASGCNNEVVMFRKHTGDELINSIKYSNYRLNYDHIREYSSAKLQNGEIIRLAVKEDKNKKLKLMLELDIPYTGKRTRSVELLSTAVIPRIIAEIYIERDRF